MTALTVVVPAFDEAARIGPTLRSYADWLQHHVRTWELLVVDDGSSDGTADVVEALDLRGVRVLRCPENRGKGHAVRLGMLAASGAVRVFTDADGSTGPEQLPVLLQPLLDGSAQVSIGSRHVAGAVRTVDQPWYRVGWGRLVNRMVRWMLLPGLRDTQCGFKGFTAGAAQALFERCTIDGWSFDLELLALARRDGWVIREVGVAWAHDDDSSVRARHFLRSLGELIAIRRRM